VKAQVVEFEAFYSYTCLENRVPPRNAILSPVIM
jgi:hypothetical protein